MVLPLLAANAVSEKKRMMVEKTVFVISVIICCKGMQLLQFSVKLSAKKIVKSSKIALIITDWTIFRPV
jgi:hypothetical protein